MSDKEMLLLIDALDWLVDNLTDDEIVEMASKWFSESTSEDYLPPLSENDSQ